MPEYDALAGDPFLTSLDELHVLPSDLRRLVRAIVLETTPDVAIVRFGADCLAHLKLRPDLNVGDEVEVLIDGSATPEGRFIASEAGAKREKAWIALEAAYRTGETVPGSIIRAVDGGYSVKLGEIHGFLPKSQLDIAPLSQEEIDLLVSTEIKLSILKAGRDRDLIVSRRAAREKEMLERRSVAIAALRVGDKRTGVVKTVVDYGVFLDLGDVDGLLHVNEISWQKIGHPSELYTSGQSLDVVVIKVVPETGRVSLSVKALLPDPWRDAEAMYARGTEHDAEIVNIVDYGAFAALQPGVEGLIHVSSIDQFTNGQTHRNLFAIGQKIRVQILSSDVDQRRISLRFMK